MQRNSSHLRRREVYPGAVLDGRAAGRGGRWRRWLAELLVSRGERGEAELERLLRSQAAPSRPNSVAVLSPKGGVGKTTSTFLVGNLLAGHLKLRVVALDANPDFGSLAALAPDAARSERSLADLLDDMDQARTASQVRKYVSALPSGLHLLAAPRDPHLMAELGPGRYGELVAFLGIYYDVVLLDLGTGVTGPLAQFAISRADQLVLVTTPEWITSSIVLDALQHLRHDRTTVVANKFYPRRPAELEALGERLRQRRLPHNVALPYDPQLASMLDTGTYTLAALERPTRMAIKKLGLSVAEQFA